MPFPDRGEIVGMLGEIVGREGYDLEDVSVTRAGKKRLVRVVVDGDEGLELDAVADLSQRISEVLDDHNSFGEAPYTLEVTSPGVDRPLTLPRHWRRAQGRRVRVVIAGRPLTARVGRVVAPSGGRPAVVELVVPGKRGGPAIREVPLDDVEHAVVEVEFAAPDRRELELAGLGGQAESADHAGGGETVGGDRKMKEETDK